MRFAALVTAVVLVALLAVAGYAAFSQGALFPPVSEARAQRVATTAMASGAVSGWKVTGDHYSPQGNRVTDSAGHLVYTSSGGPCLPGVGGCSAGPMWVVELTAPTQGQASYRAVVIVDAISGRVRASSVFASTPASGS